MAWRQILISAGDLDPTRVEAALDTCGALSVTLRDAGDRPVLEPGPGETPLWAKTSVTGLFAADTDIDALLQRLKSALGVAQLPPYRIEELADRDWEREWLKDFQPMRFGARLWVAPREMPVDADDAVVVRLDPGLAFGTGTHATTALCLEWLDGQSLTGKTLLDYGCGSGVLAIAALQLGCARAVAMDIDPQAVIATRQNAEVNGVADRLTVFSGADQISGPFDIVVANILAGPLVQIAESVTLTLGDGGMLALSGVLCEQADEVMRAYARHVVFDAPVFREQDGQQWSRLTGKRRTVQDD